MPTRPPYHGLKRKLVIAFDLGTTFSGVSYAILDPGKVPEIRTVTRFPGQDAGHYTVQTVVYYDEQGKLLAAGAEEPPIGDGGEDEDDWQDIEPLKVVWFKLLLRPKATAHDKSIPRATLPPSKDIVDVFADFYRYLYEHARTYIRETNANGDMLWASLKDDVAIVLSHPNGWAGAQQGAMRRAAVKAGMVPDTREGRERITFVSEGEASFHYCVARGLMDEVVEVGNNVMIIDAGGGTVDLSTYTFAKRLPVKISEIAAPGCIFHGSVIIRQRAHDYLHKKLKGSRFGEKAYLDTITDCFDQVAKKRFKGVGDSLVKFSSLISERDPRLGIRNGQLRLTEKEMRVFFDPSIQEIIRAIEAQREAASPAQIPTFCLVGGFAASEYLFSELSMHLKGDGVRLSRPDEHAGKAVAEGAVSFHIDHFVSTRAAQFTYGVEATGEYDPRNKSHVRRKHDTFLSPNGTRYIRRVFEPLLVKGTLVGETTEFKQEFVQSADDKDALRMIETDILCHTAVSPPEFVNTWNAGFRTMCTIKANVSHVPTSVTRGPRGKYHTREYTVVLSMGLTEFKAHLLWTDKVVVLLC
ncbi:hypothetical protein OF83DRAFT_1062097 [Amylostereum chailletii]|nr:hypothetical protein OF83DRAFT_1062097 [Amylostereum chailletii]